MKCTSTCILNHTITTRSSRRIERWWAKHEHPEVDDVTYDDEGNVAVVWLTAEALARRGDYDDVYYG